MVRKSALLEGNTPSQMSTPNLDEKIRLRAPYTAPLNILQVGARVLASCKGCVLAGGGARVSGQGCARRTRRRSTFCRWMHVY